MEDGEYDERVMDIGDGGSLIESIHSVRQINEP